MNGIELIAAERQRQIEVEGWTPEHDDGHVHGELAWAAASYALASSLNGFNDWVRHLIHDRLWPFSRAWWKPSEDRIRNLVKAGALIAAEIDRLQRATPASEASK